MNKKAEITTQQIVILIVLIVSFVVILFFLFKLNFGKTSDAEICHNAVVTRGSGVVPKESSPLNCKTHYLCLTKDGTCEKMANPDVKKVKNAGEVYNLLANEMADCWWTFGEGKINYIGTEFTSDLYCSICAHVIFDDSVDFFPENKINQKEFYNYLAVTNVSGKDMSYLNYLSGLKDAQSIEERLKNENSAFGEINLAKPQYIIMGILSKKGVVQWAGSGAGLGVIVGGLAGGLPGIIVGGLIGGSGGYMVATSSIGESGHEYLSPTIIEANSAAFNSLNCSSIKTLA